LDAIADAKRAVRRLSLVRAAGLLLAGLEQLVPQVFLGDVVDREVPGLVQELRADRVEDGFAREEAAQPVRHRVEVENRARRRVRREVEAPLRPRPERTGARCEPHAETL